MKTETIKHTAGPWKWDSLVKATTGEHVREHGLLSGADGVVLWTSEHHVITEANANLISAAPAMDLMLRLLQSGQARFEPATGEFCFNGMRYSGSGKDWGATMSVIGFEGALAVLSQPSQA